MLASASRSACSPAPLVGSVAANVRTAGRDGTDSFMGRAGGGGGLHLKPGSRCTRQPGIATMFLGARACSFYSTVTAFAYVLARAATEGSQDVALPRVRADLRRGRRMARGRHRARHPLGRHTGRLVLPGMRGA